MSLSVKAYIYPDTDQQEIRRFAVDEGASANFSYLVQKIEQVFPAIRGKAISLYWKDADHEMITFSSDEELVEALGSIGGDVFRVYVKEGGNKKTSNFGENDETAEAHPGVVCDGCDKDMVGVRFKCVVCPNFDLCLPCESKGLHKQHEMLRIATPRNSHDWFQGFNPLGPHFPPHHPPHFPPHHPPHFPPHHPPHFPPHHPPNGHPPHPSFGFPPFDHGQGFGPWGRGRGFGHEGGRGHCGKNKSRCGKEGQKCDRHGQTGEVPVGPPFLHAVGETIASFLGPFGVEVHTYASNEPDCCQGKCQETEQSSATEGPQPGPSGEGNPATPQSYSKDENKENSSGETSQMEIPPEEFVVVSGDQAKEPAPLVDIAETQMSTDPLEVAIAQMRSMGFEDDSGWLSQLIVAKDYDIGKVLDAIQFSGKN